MQAARLSLVVVAITCGALALFSLWAPGYLLDRGFPLDDAWIHLVYGRSLAGEGLFAYNPGEAATGATSLLWAAVLALLHGVCSSTSCVVVGTKIVGLILHVAGAAWLGQALAPEGSTPMARAGAIAFVGLNPDLLAASVSGMEIGLATLLLAWVVHAARRCALLELGAACALAVLARPETGLLCVAAPLVFSWTSGSPRWRAAFASSLGALLGLAALVGRNLEITGRPLPTTFYAKVGTAPIGWFESQLRGFLGLLSEISFAEPACLVVAVCLAGLAWSRAGGTARASAGAVAGAVVFFLASFWLVAPIDSSAFYHQRYVLPALPLLVVGLYWLILWSAGLLRPRLRRSVLASAMLVGGVSLLGALPGRLARLANDAQNIDDVQVKIGRSLAGASAKAVVWAVDAGAIRYFGTAYVVDMMALNVTREFLDDTPGFLARRLPNLIEVVPSWSALDRESMARLRLHRFAPTTEYSVTSYPMMRLHLLAECSAGSSGRYRVRERAFDFTCAAAAL